PIPSDCFGRFGSLVANRWPLSKACPRPRSALGHTCASRLFAQGATAVQVQRWLGHHSPAFTLSVYVHLLNDDLGGPLSMPRKPGDLALAEASAAPVAA